MGDCMCVRTMKLIRGVLGGYSYLMEEFWGANVFGGIDPAGLVAGGETVVLGAPYTKRGKTV